MRGRSRGGGGHVQWTVEAQLAASGGSYEYGLHHLNPLLGFTAGWMFLETESASAATVALGFAGYVPIAFG